MFATSPGMLHVCGVTVSLAHHIDDLALDLEKLIAVATDGFQTLSVEGKASLALICAAKYILNSAIITDCSVTKMTVVDNCLPPTILQQLNLRHTLQI